MVPGEGIEPSWSCLRRILSPFFGLLHKTASYRTTLHNPPVINGICPRDTSRFAARNCTDYRNQHAPEHAPADTADFPGLSSQLTPLSLLARGSPRRTWGNASCPKCAKSHAAGLRSRTLSRNGAEGMLIAPSALPIPLFFKHGHIIRYFQEQR